jgi:exo-beta-1,3-glucanase (GH17 family)
MIAGQSCVQRKPDTAMNERKKSNVTAKDILGNPYYQAICFGGYREKTREVQPTIEQLKEDLKILHDMGIRIVRTYNVHLPHASNVVRAIHELTTTDPSFEMYVMLGAWIDCKNAWTDQAPDHFAESARNEKEMATAIALANQYPDIIKILAVGNEAMVKWAERYYVQPSVILKWVTHAQQLKSEGKLNKDLWITSSDDFASWGGGDASYHTNDLENLIKAVDYISMHTYPYHNTHYNPAFWRVPKNEQQLAEIEKVNAAMLRAQKFAKSQYDSVVNYMKSLGIDKPVHIGETGWATTSDGFYGAEGSRATDEYKQGLYYKHMRDWTNQAGITCFYFEAFDEQWKDAANPNGSENHFGLFTLDGKAKYPLWDLVDQKVFDGLTRDGSPITKSFDGNKKSLLQAVQAPPTE